MAGTIYGTGFATLTAQNEEIASVKFYTYVYINKTSGVSELVTIESGGEEIWSQNISNGAFAVLPVMSRKAGFKLTTSNTDVVVTICYSY